MKLFIVQLRCYYYETFLSDPAFLFIHPLSTYQYYSLGMALINLLLFLYKFNQTNLDRIYY